MTSWIRMLQYEESSGGLRQLYDRVATNGGFIQYVKNL